MKRFLILVILVLSCAPRVRLPSPKEFRGIEYLRVFVNCEEGWEDVYVYYALPGEIRLKVMPVGGISDEILKIGGEEGRKFHSYDRYHLRTKKNDGSYSVLYLLAETTSVNIKDSLFMKWEGTSGILPPDLKPGFYPIVVNLKRVWVVEDLEGDSVKKRSYFIETGKKEVLLGIMVPLNEVGADWRGYPVGEYPDVDEKLKSPYYRMHRLTYKKIEGLVPVYSAEEESLKLSRHFRVGEFVCHEPKDYPKLLFVNPHLLSKLEKLLKIIRMRGIGRDFVIMSGYRTPAYNESLGNTPMSQHIYGRAADIYIDDDGDGTMDDLNGDGKIDKEDAIFLAMLIDDYEWKTGDFGGIGAYDYDEARTHGPFVHVDVRGFKARWGFGE